MKLIWNIFVFGVNLLNWLLLKLPSKHSIFTLVFYNLMIYFCFGRWSIDAVEETLGKDTVAMGFFHLFVSWPLFFAFISCWSSAKQTSADFRNNNSDSLNNVISFRDAKISNMTAQDSYEIYKQTSHLDLIKSNKNHPPFEKFKQGFNAKYGNSSPSKVFDELTKDD